MKPGRVRLRVCGVIIAVFAVLSPLCVRAQAEVDSSKTIRGGLDSVRKGHYEQAVERFEKAITMTPNSIDARLGLSWAYLKQRQFRASVEHAVKVVDQDPENARAHALIGTVLMRVGVLPEAGGEFQRALKSNEDEPLALAGMAELNLYVGNLSESIKRAREAVSRSPREPDFLYLLGQCAARQERFDEAAESYEKYLQYAPDVDSDRRARIRGLVQLYRRLNGRNLYAQSGAKTVDVPISFTEARLPLVEVMINNKGPFRLVIDSGAGFVVLSDDAARKLKMRPVASGGTSRGVSGTGRFPIIYGIIDRMSFGAMSVTNVPTYIRDVQESDKRAIDGYIGLSVLSNFIVAVDYERRVLELRPQGTAVAPPAPGDISVPYRITNGGMLSVRADIGKDSPLNFIVDTGASSTVVSQRAFDQFNLVEKQHKGVSVRVVGAGGVTENVPIVVLDRLMIQGSPQTHDFVRALVLDLDPVNETAGFEQSGIIGSDFLRFFRVEFDFDSGLLILRPNAKRGEVAPGARPPGETS